MKVLKLLIVFFISCFFITGCKNKQIIHIYNENTPISNTNKSISKSELEDIYHMYNDWRFDELFQKFLNNDIKNYRLMDKDNKLYYTAINVEEDDVLYVIIKQEKRKKYVVANLILKPKEVALEKNDFESLELNLSTIEDVTQLDKYTSYNTFHTSTSGSITTHYLKNDIIANIYYSPETNTIKKNRL